MISENAAFKIMLDTLKDFIFCKQDGRKQKNGTTVQMWELDNCGWLIVMADNNSDREIMGWEVIDKKVNHPILHIIWWRKIKETSS